MGKEIGKGVGDDEGRREREGRREEGDRECDNTSCYGCYLPTSIV